MKRSVWHPILLLAAAVLCGRAQDLTPRPSDIPTLESPEYRLIEEPSISAAMPSAEVAAEPAQPTDLARFLLDIGIQYVDTGEYEEAERAYRHALEKDPGNVELRFRLGTLYVLMKRYPEGAAILHGLVEDLPDHPLVHNNLAWIYAAGENMKDANKALYHAREALLSAPGSYSVWNTLAEAYFIAGDYPRALRSANTALDLLKAQNPDPQTLETFAAQRRKIEQAAAFAPMLEDRTGQ